MTLYQLWYYLVSKMMTRCVAEMRVLHSCHVSILCWSRVKAPFFMEPSTWTVGPTQATSAGLPGFFFIPEVKPAGAWYDHSLPSGEEVKNEWNFTSAPYVYLHSVYKVSGTFTEPSLEKANTGCRTHTHTHTHTSNFVACLQCRITRHEICPLVSCRAMLHLLDHAVM